MYQKRRIEDIIGGIRLDPRWEEGNDSEQKQEKGTNIPHTSAKGGTANQKKMEERIGGKLGRNGTIKVLKPQKA